MLVVSRSEEPFFTCHATIMGKPFKPSVQKTTILTFESFSTNLALIF